ncbi:hypothetical protein Hdeb2414_s0023g00623491 [Helianthus debilis subsp. tardiflorus]
MNFPYHLKQHIPIIPISNSKFKTFLLSLFFKGQLNPPQDPRLLNPPPSSSLNTSGHSLQPAIRRLKPNSWRCTSRGSYNSRWFSF